jgi:hypothetical protein
MQILRAPSFVIFLVLALMGLMIVLANPGDIRFIWDSFWYERLGFAITEGHYHLSDLQFHTKYPPGFPLLAAAASSFTGDVKSGGALVIVFAAALQLPLTFALARRFGTTSAYIAVLLLATHHLTLVHSRLYLTEIVFSAASTLGVLLMLQARVPLARAAMAGILLGCASLIRYEGLLLILVVIGAKLLGPHACGKRTLLSFFAAVFIPLAPWFFILQTNAPAGFFSQGYLLEAQSHSGLAHIFDFFSLLPWIGISFSLLTIRGMWICFHRPGSRIIAVWILSFCLLHSWWWYADVRFYVCILPFLSTLAAAGLTAPIAALSQDSRPARLVQNLLRSAIFFVAIWEQVQLLTPKHYEPRRYSALYLDHYAGVADACARLSQLPSGVVLVPEPNVYQHYLPNWEVLDLTTVQSLPEGVLNKKKPLYLLWDNLHFGHSAIDAIQRGEPLQISSAEGDVELYFTQHQFQELKTLPGDNRVVMIFEATSVALKGRH